MISRNLKILRTFCRPAHLPKDIDLRMKAEDQQHIENWKKAERMTTMITYGKYGLLGMSLVSWPILGLSGYNSAMILLSLGLLSFDRSVTKYIKNHAIDRVIEKNMINLDIQR